MTPGNAMRDGDVDTFACTQLQERFWRQRATGGPAALNIAMRWLVLGRLSHGAAEGALRALIQRHEILRTSFGEVDGTAVQRIEPSCPVKLGEVDLSTLTEDEATARAEAIARADALAPIDPTTAPLLRATLLRLAPDRAVLLLGFHSMIVDGWSTGLILEEFQAAAAAIEAGGVPDAREPELQFADYALWEKELLASGALEEARAFWTRQLRDIAATEVAPDHRPSATTSLAEGHRGHIDSLLVSEAFGREIEAFARRQNVTLYSLATAALAVMLHRETGHPEIVIGSQVANREAPEAATLVGPTINSITLRLPVDGSASGGAFVHNVSDRVVEALQHQRLPFEIADRLAVRRVGGPLHAVNLVVHRSYSGTTATDQATTAPFRLISLPSYSTGTQWPLNFFMIGRDEGWRLSCEADMALYTPETVRRLLEAWHQCLESLVASPDKPLAEEGGRGEIPLHDPSRQVVRFHEAGTKTPVVTLNNVSVYYLLARALGEDRPFTDIQLYHPTGPLDLSSSDLDAFVTYALRLVRWAQARGPYILGGHCVYGALALEVARRLRERGETVELVALFDTWAPGYREGMSPRDQRLRQRQINRHARLQRLDQFRRGEIGLAEITKKPILRRLRLLEPDPPPPPTEGEWFDLALRRAVASHRPLPYGGDAVLFRSDEPLRGRLFDDRMGWGPLVPGTLTKVDIRSGHLDMFRAEPAGQIASALRNVLASKDGR